MRRRHPVPTEDQAARHHLWPCSDVARAPPLPGSGLDQAVRAGDVGTADLHAHYYLLIAVGFNTQQFGQFLPAVPEWGIPPFSGGNQAYEIISTGSIVLDLLSTSAKRIVWRGIAQAEIDSEKTDEQRHERIREALHSLLLKYPKQK